MSALLVSGCATTSSSGSGSAVVGARLFVTDRCVSCHQIGGMGGTDGADLAHNITAVNYKLLKYYLVDHPPTQMDYISKFHVTAQQIRDLAAFANNTQNLMPVGSSASVAGDPAVGARLFTQYRCLECHKVNGVGGTDSVDLTHDPAAINYDLMKSELDVPPAAMNYLKKYHFSPQQISALSAFADSALKARPKKKR